MRRLRLLIAVLGICAVVSGCAIDGGATASPSDNGISSLPGSEILQKASANAHAEHSVRIKGSGECPTSAFSADIRLRDDGQAYGVVMFGSQTIGVVGTAKDVYVSAKADFWTAQSSAAAAARIGGKWVRFSRASNPCLSALTSFQDVLANYLGYSGTPTKTIGGAVFTVPAVLLNLPPDVAIWVASRGTALPVRVDDPATKTGMSMGEWGQPVTVKVPAPSDVVDASTLRHA